MPAHPFRPAQVASSIYSRSLQVENVALKAEVERINKRIDKMNTDRISTVLTHGEANLLLEKFTKQWLVRFFCRSLHKQAKEHISKR